MSIGICYVTIYHAHAVGAKIDTPVDARVACDGSISCILMSIIINAHPALSTIVRAIDAAYPIKNSTGIDRGILFAGGSHAKANHIGHCELFELGKGSAIIGRV